MKHALRLALTWTCASLILGTGVRAQPAPTPVVTLMPPLVAIGLRADSLVGQGFLMTQLDDCWAVTAAHVVKDRKRVFLFGGNRQNRVFEGEVAAKDEALDVAILRVTQPRSEPCGRDFTGAASLAGGGAVGARVIQYLVDQGGALMPRTLLLVDIDPASEFLRLRGNVVAGNSGSLIDYEGRPAGMILSIKGDEAIALRFDRLNVTLRRLFATVPNAPLQASAPGAILATAGARVRASSWPAVDAEFSAYQLLRAESGGHWLMRISDAPAWADIDLGERFGGVISEVLLERGDVARANLARRIEVWSSFDGEEWTVRAEGQFPADAEIVRLTFPAAPLRYLRLRMHPRGDGNALHGLARMRLR
jgi:hypothetical protein